MLGGGTGPAEGTKATTATPGAWNLRRMLEASEGLPFNFGFLAKGNAARPEALREQIEAGAMGLKLHEDWGTTPATIDTALTVADAYDVQVAIHTDTLNESGFVENTLAAFKGRIIRSYHSEGAGGGHAPDILKIVGQANVLPSSTNPTMPYTVNTLEEHLDMLMCLPPPEPPGARGRGLRRVPYTDPRRWPPRSWSTTSARSASWLQIRRLWAGSVR